jgi:hypothetical protein
MSAEVITNLIERKDCAFATCRDILERGSSGDTVSLVVDRLIVALIIVNLAAG